MVDGGIGVHLQHLVSAEGDVWVGKLYLLELLGEIDFKRRVRCYPTIYSEPTYLLF